jgi:parallel beta-helix repeat protein
LIVGDSGFVPANGTTSGSGTASDPYIIEGWDINASKVDGIRIWDTTAYFIIRNVFIHDGGSAFYGIWLSNVRNGRVSNVNTTRNSVGIALDESSLNNIVSGNTVTNNIDGIYIWSSSKTTISGNKVTNNGNKTATIGNGISLDSSNDSIVSGNEVSYSGDIGVYLVDSSSRNTVSGNTITSNNRGIMLDTSSNGNAIFNNTITNGSGREGSGISLDRSCSNNSISRNNITANTGNGLDVSNSSSNIFSGNRIRNNGVGVSLDSSANNNTFSRNSITNNGVGVSLDSSNDNAIFGNNITRNINGVELGGPYNQIAGSCGNIISGNIIINNGSASFVTYGISVWYWSNNNIISGNTITHTKFYGIGVEYSSSNNTISGNTITNTTIRLYYSSGSRIYHNNFINNPPLNIVGSSGNVWDNGYPSGGNYWSGYGGVDAYCGQYQNRTGSDGIGDTPYSIDTNNIDQYPFMQSSGWENYPIPIKSNVTVTGKAFGTTTLNFTVSGQSGQVGYINATMPVGFNTTAIKVFVDMKPIQPPFPIITSNGTHYFIYFKFTLSTHTITIQFGPTVLGPTVPVGGVYIPVNKVELLAPYIGLIILLAMAVSTVGYFKKRKRHTEIDS